MHPKSQFTSLSAPASSNIRMTARFPHFAAAINGFHNLRDVAALASAPAPMSMEVHASAAAGWMPALGFVVCGGLWFRV